MRATSTPELCDSKFFKRLAVILENNIQTDFNTHNGVLKKNASRSTQAELGTPVLTGRGMRLKFKSATETEGGGSQKRNPPGTAKSATEAEGGGSQQPNPPGTAKSGTETEGSGSQKRNPFYKSPNERVRCDVKSALPNQKQIDAFLMSEERNAVSIWVEGDGSCLLHAVMVTAPEIFRKHKISDHLELRGKLCNFLARNANLVISSDNQLTFNELFSQGEGDNGAKSYHGYVTKLRDPKEYADVMFIYALIFKFKVDIEVLCTLTGVFSMYSYIHETSQSIRSVLVVQKTQAYTYADDPKQTRHTLAGEHYYGTKQLPIDNLPYAGSSGSRSREREPYVPVRMDHPRASGVEQGEKSHHTERERRKSHGREPSVPIRRDQPRASGVEQREKSHHTERGRSFVKEPSVEYGSPRSRSISRRSRKRSNSRGSSRSRSKKRRSRRRSDKRSRPSSSDSTRSTSSHRSQSRSRGRRRHQRSPATPQTPRSGSTPRRYERPHSRYERERYERGRSWASPHEKGFSKDPTGDPGLQHQYLWSRPLGQAPGHTPIMGAPVPFSYVPTPHGGYQPPMSTSHGGYQPSMATSHGGYQPPMETEVVPRSKMDQLLRGTQLVLENAMVQIAERRENQLNKSLEMQSRVASFLQNSSNQ